MGRVSDAGLEGSLIFMTGGQIQRNSRKKQGQLIRTSDAQPAAWFQNTERLTD
jgi:hypothetical protein